MDWFAVQTKGKDAFGGAVHTSLPAQARRDVAASLMPAIRGFVSGQQHMVGHFTDSDAVLEFVNAKDMERLAALGTSCPDHFLRTKICPLVVDFDPAKPDVDTTLAGLADAIAQYREGYQAYYDRCKHDNGACVMLADIDDTALAETYQGLSSKYSTDVVRTVNMNVTSEDAVAAAYADIAAEFGGVDILVSNAGIASSAPIEDTTLDLWNKNMAILSTGYFLVSREAFKMFKVQDMGGAVVFVASKNGLAASPNASAYCTAKASEIHLARCLALEGAPIGVRVNVVNPDAVLKGSKIWQGEWLDQRAGTYGTDKDGLEEMYRERSMLKRSVLPEDIAEAAYFLASDLSAKSTGNIINVDAGNVQAFTR